MENVLSCTGFLLRDRKQVIVCFSIDQQFGAGHIYVNKRNVERHRYLLYAEKPLVWASKYGSVTFNLVGRDWPHDGMNEMGLVILSMGLDDTKFEPADSRFPIDENGWIQYQLDNSASVGDVLENMKKIRISSRSIGDSHFLIVDPSGRALVVEFVDGKQQAFVDEKLPHAILANDTYAHMLGFLSQQKGFGGIREDTFRVASSCSRFARVAERLQGQAPSRHSLVPFGFAVLAELKQSNTQYQVIYDPLAQSIQYRSHESNELKTISFGDYDFACTSPALMADIQSFTRYSIKSTFKSYDPVRSRVALRQFNDSTFQYFPEEALAAIAEAPLSSDCSGVPNDGFHTQAGQSNASSLAGDSLTAAVHRLAQDSVLVIGGGNAAIDFEVKLNHRAPENVDFIFEVPNSSTLIPARHFFLTPNPARISRGQTSATVRATFISGNIGKGADNLLVAKLAGYTIPLFSENDLIVRIKRKTVP